MSEAELPARLLTPLPPAKATALKRLAEIKARIPASANLVLLGASLAAGWLPALYPEAFPDRRIFNFGLPGDRTQNTLWRLEAVPVGHLRPRELVLLLGTNNLGDGDLPEAIAYGILEVLRRARTLWGEPRSVLVTVPRRGETPGFREADRLALNAALARDLMAFPDAVLLASDAVLETKPGEPPSLDPDLLHLSQAGYARLSVAVRTALA